MLGLVCIKQQEEDWSGMRWCSQAGIGACTHRRKYSNERVEFRLLAAYTPYMAFPPPRVWCRTLLLLPGTSYLGSAAGGGPRLL